MQNERSERDGTGGDGFVAVHRAMPVLQVRDVSASIAFYERIGFLTCGIWGDPPGFAIVRRDQITLALDRGRDGEPVPVNHGWAAYVYVDRVEALHAEFATLGLPHLTAAEDRPYGCRDFDVVDPDGHRIAFGTDLDDRGTGPSGA